MLYNIHDILLVESALPGYIPRFFTQEKRAVNAGKSYDLLIRHLESLPSSLVEVASSTYRDSNESSIIYSTRFGGIRIAWSLKDLEGKTTEVKISKGYHIWSKLIGIPVGGILPLEIYLKVILHLKLLSKGYAFIIAGCVIPSNSDSAILVAAPNAMGKTSVVMEFVRRQKAKLVADDTVIVDSSRNMVLSYPQPVRIRARLNCDSLPLMRKYVAPETMFNMDYLARADTLFFLERAVDNAVEEMSYEAATARLTAINRKILSYQSENTIIWYTGSNPSFGLASLADREWHILSEFLRGKKFFVIRYKGPPSYAVELVKEALNEG